MKPFPWIEMSLLVGLPLLVLAAGAFTTALAMQQGFTPLEAAVVQAAR